MSAERALELAQQVTGRRLLRSDPDHEDIAQEAALEILHAAERRPDMPEAYLMGAAKRRLYDATKHRTWTGMVTNMGTPIDPLRKPHGSLDLMVEAEDTRATAPGYLEPLLVDEAGFGEAEWGRAYGEHIDIAIARLPTEDQKVVALGVYREGKSARESLPHKHPKAAESVWHRAKTQLRQELGWIEREEAA